MVKYNDSINASSTKEYEFCKNLIYLRKKYHLSQDKIGNILNKDRSIISLLETGKRKPTYEDLDKLATYFNIDSFTLQHKDLAAEELKQQKEIINSKNKIPIYSCTLSNILLEESNIIGYEEISNDMLTNYREYFGLKIMNDKLLPDYAKGDIIIFEKTDIYKSGEDCLVAVGDSDILFKRVFIDNGVILLSIDNNNDPYVKYYSSVNIKKTPLKVLGVARELRRKIGGE